MVRNASEHNNGDHRPSDVEKYFAVRVLVPKYCINNLQAVKYD